MTMKLIYIAQLASRNVTVTNLLIYESPFAYSMFYFNARKRLFLFSLFFFWIFDI